MLRSNQTDHTHVGDASEDAGAPADTPEAFPRREMSAATAAREPSAAPDPGDPNPPAPPPTRPVKDSDAGFGSFG